MSLSSLLQLTQNFNRDLADINGDGRLTRDCFAVAMHLISRKLAGVEVPTSLPQSLIPPSMRSGASASAFTSPPPEPVRDLFSFDDEPTPVPPTSSFSTPLQPQQTGTRSAARSPPPLPSRSFAASPTPQDPFGGSFSAGTKYLGGFVFHDTHVTF
jgi:epidermal growth factor receptor substrate 15